MAAPIKQGIDYYPLDVDLDMDEKLGMIVGEYGYKGELLYIKMLAYLYKNNGYYFVWQEDEQLKFLRRYNYCGFAMGFIKEVVPRFVKWDLFDKAVFDTFQILTSVRIQKTWLEATRKRSGRDINQNYWLLKKGSEKVNSAAGPEETQKKAEETDKEKESKVNQSKVNEDGAVGTATPAPSGIENPGKQPTGAKKERQARRPTFIPPTLEEAKAFFMKKMGNQSNPKCWPEDVCYTNAQEFWLHYEANGWKQGTGNTPRPIVSWEAAAAQWISRELKGKFSGQAQPVQKAEPPTQPPMQPAPQQVPKIEGEINYLYERYCEAPDMVTVISVEFQQYDYLKSKGLVLFGQEKANEIRDKAQAHYREKNMTVDEQTLTRMMKKMGVLEVFSEFSRQGKEKIF